MVSQHIEVGSLVLHPHRHHEVGPRKVVLKHNPSDVVLVVNNRVSKTGTDSFQELNQLFLPLLIDAELYKLSNNARCHLNLKNFLVVVH